MTYCVKCGNEIQENTAFCPRCGAPVKVEAKAEPVPAAAPRRSEKGEKAEKGEKQEKQEKESQEKGEKQEKGEYGFIGWLVGGLILILIGFFALLQITGYIASGTGWAIALLIIGVIVIVAAVYFATAGRKRFPVPPS